MLNAMRSIYAIVLAVGVIACGFNDARASDAPASDAEQQPDLESWSRLGDIAWRFDDGGAQAGPAESLLAPDKSSYLFSPTEYANFRLTVEFWIEDGTNSGVFVRCSDAEHINADTCYEVNIWDNHPVQDYRTGSIVKRAIPIAHVDTIGRWNTLEIGVLGDTITAMVNGTQTARLSDNRLASGLIALQYGGAGVLRFRNLRIDSL